MKTVSLDCDLCDGGVAILLVLPRPLTQCTYCHTLQSAIQPCILDATLLFTKRWLLRKLLGILHEKNFRIKKEKNVMVFLLIDTRNPL